MKAYKAIAEYYDAEYTHQDMLQSDAPFFLQQLRRPSSILELAVGTARAAIPLAQAGHRVTGVDYDPAMLEIAQRKRDSVGLSERQLKLLPGDALTLNLRQQFDWVCLFFNTFLNFTTLHQQDAVLQAVGRHLKPSGRFWLDIFQPNLHLLARAHSVDLEPMMFYVPSLDRTVFKSTEVRRDPAAQVQHITFHYLYFDAGGREHRQKVQFDLTFLFPGNCSFCWSATA